MKILVLTNMFPSEAEPWRGIFVKEQVQSLLEASYFDLKIDVFVLPDGGMFGRYFLSAFKLFFTLLKEKPFVIHVHYGLSALPMLIIFPYLKFAGIKTIVTFHGSDVLGENSLVRYISSIVAKVADRVICVSPVVMEELLTKNQYLESKTLVIPCGVDDVRFPLQLFDPSVCKSSIKRLILFPSSPKRREKNFELFISIIEKLRQSVPEFSIDYACVDGLNRDQVRDILLKSDCLLMTSKREGSPQIVKEAIFCNLPVVSTNVGDVSSIVNGIDCCVTSDSRDMLIQGVISNLIAGSKAKILIAAVQQEFREKYSNTAISKKIIDIYYSLIKDVRVVK